MEGATPGVASSKRLAEEEIALWRGGEGKAVGAVNIG